MSKTIVVIGATGNQGGSVAEKFLSLGWHVRGITRNTTSEAAKALSAQGVELVSADLDDDPSSLVPAFSGANVIFAVTDFWAPFFASYGDLSKTGDRATGEHAMNIEIKRGKAIVDAVAEVLAKEGKLERFIYSGLPSYKDVSKGKYSYMYHYDGKAEVCKYLQQTKELWEKSSVLVLPFFMTNMKAYKASFGVMDDSKKFTYFNTGSDAVHPLVNPSDTGIFVDLLVRAPPKQKLLGVSDMASYPKFLELWTQITGIASEVQETTIEQADKAAPGGLGRELAESFAASVEFGWGGFDLILPKDLDPNLKTTSLKEYIEREDWSDFQ